MGWELLAHFGFFSCSPFHALPYEGSMYNIPPTIPTAAQRYVFKKYLFFFSNFLVFLIQQLLPSPHDDSTYHLLPTILMAQKMFKLGPKGMFYFFFIHTFFSFSLNSHHHPHMMAPPSTYHLQPKRCFACLLGPQSMLFIFLFSLFSLFFSF